MRLIDADPLRENMKSVCMGIMAGTEPYSAPLAEIDNAPTIEERKTGKWEKIRESYCSWSCSVCKGIVVAMPEQMGYPLYDYCPNCGARMEGNT